MIVSGFDLPAGIGLILGGSSIAGFNLSTANNFKEAMIGLGYLLLGTAAGYFAPAAIHGLATAAVLPSVAGGVIATSAIASTIGLTTLKLANRHDTKGAATSDFKWDNWMNSDEDLDHPDHPLDLLTFIQ